VVRGTLRLAEEDCSLDELLAAGSGVAFYEYDFGDSWLHWLDVVTRRPRNETDPPARLLAGAGSGPLEDSGGFPGYGEILYVLADPADPDHAEVSEWVADVTGTDEPYDPGFLDVDAVNRALNGRSKAVRVP
jgi:Plasmid pRiA4b ORF-3-like protein